MVINAAVVRQLPGINIMMPHNVILGKGQPKKNAYSVNSLKSSHFHKSEWRKHAEKEMDRHLSNYSFEGVENHHKLDFKESHWLMQVNVVAQSAFVVQDKIL